MQFDIFCNLTLCGNRLQFWVILNRFIELKIGFIYPDEFDELLKKSREKKATPHYKVNSRGNGRGGK